MSPSKDPAVAEMLEALKAVGIETAGFGAFSRRAEWFDHRAAAPILLRWLPKIEDVQARESIIRSLTGEPTASAHGAAPALVAEFKRSVDEPSIGWAAANALATLADPAVADDLIELLHDRRFGRSRQMLCEALKRTGDERTPAVLVEMIEDDDVAGHAVAVLGSLRSSSAILVRVRERLEDLAERSMASSFARKQARRALARIHSR